MNKQIRCGFRLLALLLTADIYGSALAQPAAGSTWTEPTTGMEFVFVPGGCFSMGSNDGDSDELPVHRVCIKGFYIGKYEVTQAQYQRGTDSNPSKFRESNRPVETISFDDAQNMAQELSARSGVNVRLPTEAEWEYACRAGGRHDIYCGDEGAGNLGWIDSNSGKETHIVGLKRANAWGLYDMSGNVWEWTQDCYHATYQGAPSDGSAWAEDCEDRYRVVRGGSWVLESGSARSAGRRGNSPGNRYGSLGFRLARTP
jgi:formylglycine-generating enzyme required for sulfatase activity